MTPKRAKSESLSRRAWWRSSVSSERRKRLLVKSEKWTVKWHQRVPLLFHR